MPWVTSIDCDVFKNPWISIFHFVYFNIIDDHSEHHFAFLDLLYYLNVGVTNGWGRKKSTLLIFPTDGTFNQETFWRPKKYDRNPRTIAAIVVAGGHV